jgi:hypothetical protein
LELKEFRLVPPSTSSSTWDLQASRIVASRVAIHAEINFFTEDGVACFFFSDYVLDESRVSNNLFDTLPGLYANASTDSPLTTTITALGMACLSNTLNIPEIMMKANVKYAKSLNSINAALRDPVEAKSDQTLLVVILLGLYEEVMSPPPPQISKIQPTNHQHNNTTPSLDPWTNHVNGAMALLDYRGKSQLERQGGLQLISALRTSVVNFLNHQHSYPVSNRVTDR